MLMLIAGRSHLLPPYLPTPPLQASRQASLGDLPCRIISTTVCAPQILMFSSPRPVEPAAPTSLSTKSPAPMIGESPTRPGILKARPLVVVVPEMSPRSLTARQFMVPVGGWATIRSARASSSGLSVNNELVGLVSGEARPGPQESLSLMDSFHFNHTRRDSSVRRSSFLKPCARAKRRAPSPTNNI